MKFFILLLLFTGCAALLAAQSAFYGSVVDDKGRPLPHATITAENPADSAVLAFAIADAKGAYQLQINTDIPKLLLRMRLMNYATQFVLIENKSRQQHFTTHPEAVLLKEVVVRPGLIIKNGDTLSYDADAFAGKQDRTLADVLKKLPGVDVSESGQISVQGEPINKFYVEGKDMMGGRYGVVANSMPNKDVARIEVLNNHQPIKMLQGKIPSIQPAINIRLKKAVSFSGRANAGAGFSPFLWSVAATPIWFAKKQQALLTYTTNNTGNNVAGEMNELFFVGGFEGKTVSNNTGERLAAAGPALPAIPLRRYLLNNVHSVSANALTGFSKDWELRMNTNYVNDFQTRDGGYATEVRTLQPDGSTSGVIRFARKSRLILNRRQFNARAVIGKNAKENFIKNITTLRTDNSADNGLVYFNNDPVQQRLQSPGFSIQNSFSASLPANKKKTHNFIIRSFVNYVNERQGYDVQPAAVLQPTAPELAKARLLHQQLSFKNIEIEKDISVALSYKKWIWQPAISWALQKNNLQSDLHAKDSNLAPVHLPGEWRNHLLFSRSVPAASLGIHFENEMIRFSASLPVKQYHISAIDAPLNFAKTLDRTAFEPNLFLRFAFLNFWDMNMSAGCGNQFSTADNLYPASIFSGLGFSAYRADVLHRRLRRASTGIGYKNNLNNIFGNIGYAYLNTRSNIIIARSIGTNGLQIFEAVNMNNGTSSHTLQAQIGKFIVDLKTNLKFSYVRTFARTNTLLNQVLMDVNTTSHSFNTELSNNGFYWMSLEYNVGFTASKREAAGILTSAKRFTHRMNAFFYPVKNTTVSASWDNTVYQLAAQRFENNFFDVAWQYNLAKRKMDFEIKLTNILNTQTYHQVTVSSIETNQVYYKIRPRQLLFSVKFNLR